jgi:hypothetical protein
LSAITDFLYARLAEDEALAKKAAASSTPAMDVSREPIGPAWEDSEGMVLGKPDKDGYRIPLWDNEGSWTLSMDTNVSAHVARHDPARVLAECAGKRDTLGIYIQMGESSAPEAVPVWLVLAEVVVNMARPYRAHPDYDWNWEAVVAKTKASCRG